MMDEKKAKEKATPKIPHAKNTVPKDFVYVNRPGINGKNEMVPLDWESDENGRFFEIELFSMKNASMSFSDASAFFIKSFVLWSIFQNMKASSVMSGPIIKAQYELVNFDLDCSINNPAPIIPVSSVMKN